MIRKFTFGLQLVALGLVFSCLTGCSKDEATDPGEATVAEPSSTSSGVDVRVIKNGYGRAVEAGDYLTVHTTGWLLDESAPDNRGEQFWSSHDSGQKFQFMLGAGQVIQGWDQGVPGMLIGEVRELTIPPEMGYGDRGSGPVPPGATLVFEIELFEADGPGETAN